jgi:hypothetical protein
MVVELVEKPLPKPSTRAISRLGFLRPWARRGWRWSIWRGASRETPRVRPSRPGRRFMAALLRLELEKLKALAKTEEERKWLESKAVPRVPTTKMKELSRLLKEAGHEGITAWTALALDLHDYQYHGPDPDMALSKYTTRESAAADVVELLQELLRRVEVLKGRVSWTEELEKSLEEVKGVSARWM